MLYKTWLADWLTNYVMPSAKNKTYTRYADIVDQHLVPKLGDYEIEDLTPIIVQRYITELMQNGVVVLDVVHDALQHTAAAFHRDALCTGQKRQGVQQDAFRQIVRILRIHALNRIPPERDQIIKAAVGRILHGNPQLLHHLGAACAHKADVHVDEISAVEDFVGRPLKCEKQRLRRKRSGFESYSDYDEMLVRADIDAVIVATDAIYHVPIVKKAMEAGKHVLSEIPSINPHFYQFHFK